MSIFSDNLKWLRKKHGESQDTLGKSIGKSRDAVAKYELGENEPNIETLIKVSRHYSVSVDSLITNDEYVVFNSHTELARFKKYLGSPAFIPYFCLAIKLIEHGIDIQDMDNYAESIIKYARKNNKLKTDL